VPTACSYQLNKTVPSDAVFTDTHVTQHLTNNNVNLPILLSTSGITDATIDATSYTIRNNSIYANPSEGSITATLKGSVDGQLLRQADVETVSAPRFVYVKLGTFTYNSFGTLCVHLGGASLADELYINYGSGNAIFPMVCGWYASNSRNVKEIDLVYGTSWSGNCELWLKVYQTTTLNIAVLKAIRGHEFTVNTATNWSATTTSPTFNKTVPLIRGMFGDLSGSATHADTSSQSGFVENHGDNLKHYWMKLWEVNTNSQFSEVDVTFLLQSSYQEMQGTLHIRIRQNGKGGSTGWDFTTSMRLTSGNIDKTRVRLYYNNSTGNCQLWYDCKFKTGNINAKMLHKTARWSNEVPTLGTMYSTTTNVLQTLPGTGYKYVEPTYVVISEWNNVQNKPSSYPVAVAQTTTYNNDYPLVWSSDRSTENTTVSLLYKSFDKLTYNPSRNWLKSGILELYP
jgi:hypothetical protein